MPIPRPIDYRLASIRCLADNVVNSLAILHHCGGDGQRLREQLKEFAETVVDAANEIIHGRETES